MMELHICNDTGSILRSYALGDSSEIIVGRDESCDVQIRARSISREHCLIEQQGQDLFIRDLGSSTGTFVSGKRVDEARIQDGMEVKIGPALLKFVDGE